MSLGRPLFWLGAVWYGVAIHLDWHLGRPGHDHLSFDSPWHWLFALPAIAPLAWMVRQKAGAGALRWAAGIIIIGVVLGQVLEPIWDEWDFAWGVRWQIFLEFMAASLLTWLVTDWIAARSPKTA